MYAFIIICQCSKHTLSCGRLIYNSLGMIQDISAHVIFMFLMIALISAHNNASWLALHKHCSIGENTTVVQWPLIIAKWRGGGELAG